MGARDIIATPKGALRGEAFAAASFLNNLKTESPFWKKQHVADGGSSDWVEAKAEDDAAAQKWRA